MLKIINKPIGLSLIDLDRMKRKEGKQKAKKKDC